MTVWAPGQKGLLPAELSAGLRWRSSLNHSAHRRTTYPFPPNAYQPRSRLTSSSDAIESLNYLRTSFFVFSAEPDAEEFHLEMSFRLDVSLLLDRFPIDPEQYRFNLPSYTLRRGNCYRFRSFIDKALVLQAFSGMRVWD